MRVLVVEDNALIAMELCEELADAGHIVLGPVGNSNEAHELIDANQPQIAFVDLDLVDGLTGPDIASRLHRTDTCFVVLASSDVDVSDDKIAYCHAVLSKPYMPADAAQTVQAVADYRAGQLPDWPKTLKRFIR